MRVAILYHSQYEGNTMKVLEAIKENYKVELVDVTEKTFKNIGAYDVIGIASEMYDERSQQMLDYVKENIKNGRKFFVINNAAEKADRCTQEIEKIMDEKNGKLLGKFHCCENIASEEMTEDGSCVNIGLSGAVEFYRGLVREQRNNSLC